MEHVYEIPDQPTATKTGHMSLSRLKGKGPHSPHPERSSTASKPQPPQPSSCQQKDSSKPTKKSFFLNLSSRLKKKSSEGIESKKGGSGKVQGKRHKKGGPVTGKAAKEIGTTQRIQTLPDTRYRIDPVDTPSCDKTYEEDDDLYTVVDEIGLPPPPLPSREYLLDKDFIASLETEEQDSKPIPSDGYIYVQTTPENNSDSESDDSYVDVEEAGICPRVEPDHSPAMSDGDMEGLYINVNVDGDQYVSESDSVDYEYMQPDVEEDTDR